MPLANRKHGDLIFYNPPTTCENFTSKTPIRKHSYIALLIYGIVTYGLCVLVYKKQ